MHPLTYTYIQHNISTIIVHKKRKITYLYLVPSCTNRRSKYTEEEDEQILQYIAKNPFQYGGNRIWKKMETMQVRSEISGGTMYIICFCFCL